MCFWFGLEILRLIIKKRLLKYWTVPILFDLLSSEKSSEFYADLKNVQKFWVWQKGNFFQKNMILGTLGKFGKNCFSEKKSLGTSWSKSSAHIWNQRKILLFLLPFAPNFEEIFFNSYKGQCCFLKLKAQIR